MSNTTPSGASGSAPSAGDVLLALADRCEREDARYILECDIATAVGWRQEDAGGFVYWYTPEGLCGLGIHPPRYTTSLDAARALVPKPHTILHAMYMPDQDLWVAGVTVLVQGREYAEKAHAKTEPMARCAAALRARAALVQS